MRTIKLCSITLLVVALTSGGLAFGAASTLGPMNAKAIASGAAPINRCDPDGFTATYNVSDGNVVDVTIGDIAAGCAGGTLRLTLADETGAAVGTGGPVSVTSTSATVLISPQPSSSTVARSYVVIEGP